MVLSLNLEKDSYDIVVLSGALNNVGEYLNLNRKVLILTDSGVPSEYANTVLNASLDGYVYVIPEGEASKSFENYKNILSFMAKNNFTRTDCLVSVGGGVVGDLGGFVASSYMRGIDFYNVPTTLLSQLDSSIGGKVAIDLDGYKNIVGAFYQPKKVVIDPLTLKTLDQRQKMAGLCEAIKMAATSDKELFELIENAKDLESELENVIIGGLSIKKAVVEEDPYEKGLRKILNFGHTIGHAVESNSGLGTLLHGECVAIGMLPMCAKSERARLEKVLKKYNLPTNIDTDTDILLSYIKNDKKASGKKITVCIVPKIGEFSLVEINIEDMKNYIEGEGV